MKALLNKTPPVEAVANRLSPPMGRRFGMAAILATACILPFVISGYHVSQFSQVLIYAITMMGLNILTGFNGQISLGHGAFYAIGAYTTAILLDKTGIPYWATVPIAGAICLGTGFLFGLPALRLEGLYLALATLALAVATPQILKFKGFDNWTGGVQGLQVDTPAAPFGLPLSPDSFPVLLSIKFLVGSVVGGIASISGAFIGALFIEFTPNLADQISKAAPDAIFAIFLIGLMYLMPAGVVGIFNFIGVRFRRGTVARRQY